MSINRTCPICFQEESIRINFGDNREVENEFHSQKWCNCGYNSSTEMMNDQDLGFNNSDWVPIAKYFIENYHSSISQGAIKNSDELVRFFLKLLKSSANNINKSIEIIEIKENEEYEYIYEGKAKQLPKSNIFKDTLFSNINFKKEQLNQNYQSSNPKFGFNWLHQIISLLLDFILIGSITIISSIPIIYFQDNWMWLGVLISVNVFPISYYLSKRIRNKDKSIALFAVSCILVFLIFPSVTKTITDRIGMNSKMIKFVVISFQVSIVKWVFEIILSKLGFEIDYPIIEWLKEKIDYT